MSLFKKIFLNLFILAVFAGLFINILKAQDNQPILLVEPGDHPAPTLAVANSWEQTFTVFKLTALRGDVNVNNLTVQRMGVARDGAFLYVQVREIGTDQDIGKAKALNSDHQHNTRYNFTIKKGETRTFKIMGDMEASLSSYDGEKPQLAVVNIDSDATVQGLPVVGPAHIINSMLTIGSMTVSQGPLDPGAAQNLTTGEKKVFNSIRIDVGQAEPLVLQYVIWTQLGSAGPEDITNLTTNVNYKGQIFSFPTDPYSTGSNPQHEWIAALDSGIRMEKGDAAEIYISGEPVSGVGRTIDFVDSLKVSLTATGVNYGYGILGYNTHDSAAHTIRAGSMQVSPWNLFLTQYLGEEKLGNFILAVNREPMRVFSFEIKLAGSLQVQNVKIWGPSGKLVAGPINASDGRATFFNLPADSWLVPVGETTYTVTGSSGAAIAGKFNFVAEGTRTGLKAVKTDF
ncbi:MAG: hypothetical protein HZB99_02885 [Candidatus Harrisonbacteria bacterium]|nr:hypothetical protein [Candidatus Harrisonbacteria bacterium]